MLIHKIMIFWNHANTQNWHFYAIADEFQVFTKDKFQSIANRHIYLNPKVTCKNVHRPYDIKNHFGGGAFNNIFLHANKGSVGYLTTETLFEYAMIWQQHSCQSLKRNHWHLGCALWHVWFSSTSPLYKFRAKSWFHWS